MLIPICRYNKSNLAFLWAYNLELHCVHTPLWQSNWRYSPYACQVGTQETETALRRSKVMIKCSQILWASKAYGWASHSWHRCALGIVYFEKISRAFHDCKICVWSLNMLAQQNGFTGYEYVYVEETCSSKGTSGWVQALQASDCLDGRFADLLLFTRP